MCKPPVILAVVAQPLSKRTKLSLAPLAELL